MFKDCGPSSFTAVYLDIPTGFTAHYAYVRAYGYALFKRDFQPSKVLTRVIYACNKEGKGDSKP